MATLLDEYLYIIISGNPRLKTEKSRRTTKCNLKKEITYNKLSLAHTNYQKWLSKKQQAISYYSELEKTALYLYNKLCTNTLLYPNKGKQTTNPIIIIQKQFRKYIIYKKYKTVLKSRKNGKDTLSLPYYMNFIQQIEVQLLQDSLDNGDEPAIVSPRGNHRRCREYNIYNELNNQFHDYLKIKRDSIITRIRKQIKNQIQVQITYKRKDYILKIN